MPTGNRRDPIDSVNRRECPACSGSLRTTEARRVHSEGAARMECKHCGRRWALIIESTSLRVEEL